MKQQKLKNSVLSRKAQLQMMENSFILIIIFIILVFAFIVVFAYQKGAQKDKLEELHELELVKKSQVLNFLPEMQCMENNNLMTDCYDLLKIVAFKEQTEEDRLYYASLLGNIRINIKQFDPSPDVNTWVNEWEIYDNPKKDDFGYKQVQVPVLLRDSVNDTDYFGVIFLDVYK